MATFTKLPFLPAGTTGDGLGIPVTAISSPGTAIHTSSSTPTTIDELWIYAVNYDASDRKLTLQYGGTTAGANDIEFTVKAENGLYLIVPGLIIQGNSTPRVVRAFAATASSIVIYGYVNRIA